MGKALTWLRLRLPLGSGSRGLGILLLDLAEKETLEVSIRPIHLLHLHKRRRLYIRQPNGDGLHLTASSRSSFSAFASLQKAEILRQRLLFSKSSAWWSCWGCGGGSRGRRDVDPGNWSTSRSNLFFKGMASPAAYSADSFCVSMSESRKLCYV